MPYLQHMADRAAFCQFGATFRNAATSSGLNAFVGMSCQLIGPGGSWFQHAATKEAFD